MAASRCNQHARMASGKNRPSVIRRGLLCVCVGGGGYVYVISAADVQVGIGDAGLGCHCDARAIMARAIVTPVP